MKKTFLLGLTLMAMLLCLFVACSPDMALPEDKDGVAYVRFGGYTARSFTADYNIQQYENLYWFYTAEKTDGYGTYGATTALAPVNATRVDGTVTEVKKGLNGTIGPFSQGDWKFTLKAYSSLSSTDAKAPDESTLVYINDGEINVTLRGGETKSISANVKAFGETGFLSFRTLTAASVEGGTATETNVAFFKWANETSSTTLPCFTIEATRLGTNELYTLTTDETITTGNVTYIVLGEYDETNKGYPIQYFKTVSGAKVSADISLPVDYYSCKIYAYRPGETNEKNVIAMDKTFGFRIYGGATTVVKGDLTEKPNSFATFDVPKIAIVSVIPKAEETTKITAYVAPKEVSTEAGEAGGGQTGGAGEAGGDSGTGDATTVASTNVDIPAGVLDSSGETTYSLEVSALSENKASNSFTVTASSSSAEGEEGSTGEAQIYGSISLSLNAIKGTTSTQVTEFKDASTQQPKAVTVSVFVGKGLEDITVKYIDEEGKVATDGQPTVEGDGLGYDATTGYITFSTTHFSTFVVASTKPAVVKNISQGKLYTTLEKAISSLDGTTELELVGTLAENTTIKLTEAINLVVDLKEKELKNITLEAGSGSLTLKNGSVSTATVKTGEVTFQNITSTNISLDKDYDGTITFDGGKLKAAAEGETETAGYAFKVAENEMTSGKAPTYIFRNVEVTAGSLRGIKIVYAKSITVHNCTFNGTSLSASTSSNQPDYLTRALSALDIAVYSPNVDISIIGCTFNNITGAEAADAVATATDTAGAIKIKAQKVGSTAGSLGNVIIKNNTFENCVRDVVVGKADTASQSFIYGTNPAIDVEGNVLSGWTITGNTSNKTSEVGNVGILVYTDSSGTKQSKKIGKVVGGCTVYDISTAYEAKIGDTLYFTLDDAIGAAKNGDTIILLDCSKSNDIPENTSEKTLNWIILHGNCSAANSSSEGTSYWHETSSKFSGGYGTKAEPYLIANKEQLQNITDMYEKYAYYKIKDGVTEIDCSNWVSLQMFGSFDGNGVKLKNIDQKLFRFVGKMPGADWATLSSWDTTLITLENFEANFNLEADLDAGASMIYQINGNNTTTIEKVTVTGKLVGGSNSGVFFQYTGANYNDKNIEGLKQMVEIKECSVTAHLVSTSGPFGVVAAYPSYCNPDIEITCDKNISDLFKGTGLVQSGSAIELFAFSYSNCSFKYNNKVAKELSQEEAKTTTNVSYLTKQEPTYVESTGYSVTWAEKATRMEIYIAAQLDETDESGAKTKVVGITMALAKLETRNKLEAETSVKVLDQVTKIDLKSKQSSYNATLVAGTLSVTTAGNVNYTCGYIKLQVAQFDSEGNLVAFGSKKVAKRSTHNGEWEFNPTW